MTQNVKKKPEAQNTKKAPEEEKAKKYTVNFSFSGMMTGLTMLVGCIVISFMMGVIVGRDEEPLPGMEKVLPSKDSASVAVSSKDGNGVAKGSAIADGASKGEKSAASGEGKDAAKDRVMTPEELKYASVLKAKGHSASPSKEGNKAAPPTKAQENKPADKSDAKAKEEADALFDFVFQVSSLKDETAVDTLRAKLEGEGLRTRMAKSGQYYIVFVLLRGTVQQAEAVRARMIALKLGDPLQKQKTAVQ